MAWENGESSRSRTAPKLERKYIEKNRRNHLKSLYKHLFSLLPTHLPQEGMALHDQVDETVKYISSLQKQLEKKKQELQKKMSRKRKYSCISTQQSEPPWIQVLDISPDMALVLITALQTTAEFHNIIRLVHKHGLEVTNANFQHENSMLQIVSQQGLFGGTMLLSEKLRQVIYGSSSSSSCSEVLQPESLDSWNYDIWGFPALEPLEQLQYPPPY